MSRTGLLVSASFAAIVSFGDVLSGALLGGGVGSSVLGSVPLFSNMIMSEYASSTNLPRTSALAMILVLVMVLMLAGGCGVGRARARSTRAEMASAIRPLDPLAADGRWWRAAGRLYHGGRLLLPGAADRHHDRLLLPEGPVRQHPRPRLDAALVRQAVRRRHAARSPEQQPHRLAARRDRRLRAGLSRRLFDPPLPLPGPRRLLRCC